MKDEVQGRKEHNERVLSRMKGLQAQPSTPESDADPRNPNQRNDNAPIADSSEAGTGGAGGADMGDWTEPFSTLRDMWQEDECPNWPQVAGIIEQLCRRAYPDRSALSIGKSMAGEALRLLAAEDERQSKLHEILETIREQIRLSVAAEHRPDGLFKNIQDAVYAMRGRTPLMNDVAITAALSAPVGEPVAFITKSGFKNWLQGDGPENHVLLRTGGDLRVALYTHPVAWECVAQRQSLPEPADCDWPVCGCDPHANKVIESLEEQGVLSTHPPAPAVGAEEMARDRLLVDPRLTSLAEQAARTIGRAERLDIVSQKEVYRTVMAAMIDAILSLLSGQVGGK